MDAQGRVCGRDPVCLACGALAPPLEAHRPPLPGRKDVERISNAKQGLRCAEDGIGEGGRDTKGNPREEREQLEAELEAEAEEEEEEKEDPKPAEALPKGKAAAKSKSAKKGKARKSKSEKKGKPGKRPWPPRCQ